MKTKYLKFFKDLMSDYVLHFETMFTSEEQEFLNEHSDLLLRYFGDLNKKVVGNNISFMSYSSDDIKKSIDNYCDYGEIDSLLKFFSIWIKRDLVFKLRYMISLNKSGTDIENLIGLDELGINENVCEILYLYNLTALGVRKPLRVAQDFSNFTTKDLNVIIHLRSDSVEKIKRILHKKKICLADEENNFVCPQVKDVCVGKDLSSIISYGTIYQQIIDKTNHLLLILLNIISSSENLKGKNNILELPLKEYNDIFGLISNVLSTLNVSNLRDIQQFRKITVGELCQYCELDSNSIERMLKIFKKDNNISQMNSHDMLCQQVIDKAESLVPGLLSLLLKSAQALYKRKVKKFPSEDYASAILLMDQAVSIFDNAENIIEFIR